MLEDVAWGVLAVAEGRAATNDSGGGTGAQPVAVPTSYAVAGGSLYLTMGEGRKLEALRENPRLCLTVTAVQSLARWRSVAVFGYTRWLTSDAERAIAISAFTDPGRPIGHRLTGADVERLRRAHLAEVTVEEMRGFESGDEVGAPAERAEQAMNAIRRLVRALRSASSAAEVSHGVSGAQLFVMREVAKAGALTIGELAQRTATAQSSVSEVVTRLVSHGLLLRTRSATDRRRAEVTLSQGGADALAHATVTVQERLLAAFRSMPPELQRRLAEGLDDWIAASGLGDVTASMFFEP